MNRWCNRSQQRLGLALVAAGLAAVAATEWRAWQADRPRTGPPPIPKLPAGLRPRVTVLVAAWRERGNIARLLDSFAALRYADRELVLCAGGDGDGFSIGGGHVALHRVAAHLGRVARPEVVAHAALDSNRVQLRV